MNSSGFGKQMIPGSLPAPADAGAMAAAPMPAMKKKKLAPPAPVKKAKAKPKAPTRSNRPTKSAWIGRKARGNFGAM